jgi:ketosteroid isomerase-like protein
MRMILLAFAAVVCVACGTKQAANGSDSAAPATATLAGIAASSSSTDELKRFVDAVQPRYIEAVVKADVAALNGFYTDDAIVIAPNVKASHGRAEIDTANAHMLAMAKFTGLKLHTDHLEVVGEMGIETGTYEQTLKPHGKVLHDTGNYLAVWKRQQPGVWKLYRLAYDSDVPAPKS